MSTGPSIKAIFNLPSNTNLVGASYNAVKCVGSDKWQDTCHWYDYCNKQSNGNRGAASPNYTDGGIAATKTGNYYKYDTVCNAYGICWPEELAATQVCDFAHKLSCRVTQRYLDDEYTYPEMNQDGCRKTRLCGRSLSVRPQKLDRNGNPVNLIAGGAEFVHPENSCGEPNIFKVEISAKSKQHENRIDLNECKGSQNVISGTIYTHNFNECACKPSQALYPSREHDCLGQRPP